MAQNNQYWFSDDGKTGYGRVSTSEVFVFDAEDFEKIKDTIWYRCNKSTSGPSYIGDHYGFCIHRKILVAPLGYEIDHINLNPLDNRKCNLRVVTHQQNQCNQPLQRNNTSGVSGVSYYPPRKKYRARIKYFQREAHLGYYNTFQEAVQARNAGMRILFGEFGRYSDVPDASASITEYVASKCSRLICETADYFCAEVDNAT